MAKAKSAKPNDSSANLGFEAKLWLAADKLRNNMDAPELATRKSARIMLETIGEHVRKRESFAFETTRSGRGYARHIPEWRALGYHVELFFLRLPTAALNRACGATRAARRARHTACYHTPPVCRRPGQF